MEGGIIMNNKYSECSAEIGSVTYAMKAQSALAAAAIPSEIIKSEASSRRGCIYSISYSCSQANNVRAVLASARIPVKHWNYSE